MKVSKKDNDTQGTTNNNNSKDIRKLLFYFLLLIVVILIVILVVVNVNKNSEFKDKDSNSSKNSLSINTSILVDLNISPIKLNKEGENYVLTSEIINDTQEEKGEFDIQIVAKDKDDNIILTLSEYIPKIQSGEKYELSVPTTFDLSSAKKIDIIDFDETYNE